MYCKNCGKNNPEGSKFCQYCGIKLSKLANKNISSDKSTEEVLTSNISPYPYVISIQKLIILSVATFGIYDIYWFYKHWKSFKVERNLKVKPWARAFFSTLMSYSLFKEVSKAERSIDKTKRGLEAGGLAIAYFILVSLYKLQDPYWFLSMFSFLPLIPAQNSINFYWEKKYGNRVTQSTFGTWNYILSIIGGILIVLALYGSFGLNLNTNSTSTTGDFKTGYRSSFISSCESGNNGATELCTCMADYMITNKTADELVQISKDYQATGKLPQALTDQLVSFCASSSTQ